VFEKTKPTKFVLSDKFTKRVLFWYRLMPVEEISCFKFT